MLVAVTRAARRLLVILPAESARETLHVVSESPVSRHVARLQRTSTTPDKPPSKLMSDPRLVSCVSSITVSNGKW